MNKIEARVNVVTRSKLHGRYGGNYPKPVSVFV